MSGHTLQQLYDLYIQNATRADAMAREWQEKVETAKTPHQAGVWRAKAKSCRDRAAGNRTRAAKIKEKLEKRKCSRNQSE